MGRITVGAFEVVSLPELGLHDVVAKIDTGAYSGAVHCTNISVKTADEGLPTLHFTVAGKPELAFATTDFTQKRVRSATGHEVQRFVLHTRMTIQGKSYDVTIGISDRSTLTCPVLVGRKFLREHHMLVDVSQNTEYDPEGAQL